MGLSEFEEQALTAVQEAIAWHTVAIDVSLGSKSKPRCQALNLDRSDYDLVSSIKKLAISIKTKMGR